VNHAPDLPTLQPIAQQVQPATKYVSVDAKVLAESVGSEASKTAKVCEVPTTEFNNAETNAKGAAHNNTKRSADAETEGETNNPPLKKAKADYTEDHQTTTTASITDAMVEPATDIAIKPTVKPAVGHVVEPEPAVVPKSVIEPRSESTVESTPAPSVKLVEAITPSSTRSLTPSLTFSLATNPLLAEKMRLLEERRARAAAVKKRADAAEEKRKIAVAKAGEKHKAKLEEIEREMLELDRMEREAEEAERGALAEVEMLEMEE